MADPLPPLGGLSLNAPPGPPPPVFPMRDLPPELIDEVLASYLARLELEELCEGNLLQICMLLRGTNQCNDPDDPLWKAACARFGLTERLLGGTPDAPAPPTWHVTFLAMCNEVAALEPHNLRAYKGLLRGEDAYEDGPFSDDDDSEDDDDWDDEDDEEAAAPQRRLRINVRLLWFRAVGDELFCTMHYLLRRVDGLVHANDDEALRHASYLGRLTAVELLLAHGAHVNTGDDRPLRSASQYGHLTVVEVLLAHGADVHARDDEALVNASAHDHAAVVEVLLAHGADVHADDDEALRDASERGHAAVVEALLAHGADVHARNDEALLDASRNGHDAVVEVLLAHGANVHAGNDVALWEASFHGHDAVVEVLRAAGATEENYFSAF